MDFDKVHIFETENKLHIGFTQFINELLGEKEHINICLSGGDTPKALFDYWSTNEKLIDWSRVSFFWGDERCVPPTDSDSNYGMTKAHLFDKITVADNQINRIVGERDPEEEAERYAKSLDEKLPKVNGIPQFDLLILGLGTDGHTVSIFPHQIDLWYDKRNCVVAQHPGSYQNRVSLTGKIVNNARHAAFLVTGTGKREKVRTIIENREAFKDRYPAALVKPTSGNLHWFLDAFAGQQL